MTINKCTPTRHEILLNSKISTESRTDQKMITAKLRLLQIWMGSGNNELCNKPKVMVE